MTPVSKTPQSPARFDNDWLCKSLQAIVGSPVSEVVCSPLQGDASDRQYHRVFYQTEISGKPSKSMILMQLEDPLPGQDNEVAVLGHQIS
jgi:hypothetical protein